MTADSTGYFCQMDILGHPGPKAQVHLATYPGKPLFFSQVKDAVAYLRMPEQIDTVTATYVSDMGAAASWADPGVTNWIAADKAVYVVGSDAKGGMDAPEFVPFSDARQGAGLCGQPRGAGHDAGPYPQRVAGYQHRPRATATRDYAARLRALSKTGG